MKGKCAACPHHACYTKGINCTELSSDEVITAYTDEERRIMEAAAYVEGTFYSRYWKKKLGIMDEGQI